MTSETSSPLGHPPQSRPSLFRWAAAVVVIVMGGAATFLAARAGQAPLAVPVPDRVAMLERFLALTPEQAEAVRAADPTFIDDSARLVTALRDRRQALATILDRPSATDAEIRTGLAAAMELESALELRVGDFVLRVRPVLTEPQRRQLLGLVSSGLTTNAGPHLQDGATR